MPVCDGLCCNTTLAIARGMIWATFLLCNVPSTTLPPIPEKPHGAWNLRGLETTRQQSQSNQSNHLGRMGRILCTRPDPPTKKQLIRFIKRRKILALQPTGAQPSGCQGQCGRHLPVHHLTSGSLCLPSLVSNRASRSPSPIPPPGAVTTPSAVTLQSV